ncbi:MAG: hypothetical protein E7616_07755 [Ruminococcaceae bacterium]|nr:hypothetical protein [Oscillospiraceae bacterium]
MKKILALLMTLFFLSSMLVSCDNTQKILKKANAALQEAPYAMTLKISCECDNKEYNKIFSSMDMRIPITVDGKNISMDLKINVNGYRAIAKVIVADMVVYNKVETISQTVKMKADMNDEQYQEFMEKNNAEMMLSPKDFGELTVETKDGKEYIACDKVSEEGLEELNDMIAEILKSLDGEATVSDVAYGVTLNDGKYESMEMTCVYSVTVGGETCNVTYHLSAEFTYGNIPKVYTPEDASSYQEISFDELMG